MGGTTWGRCRSKHQANPRAPRLLTRVIAVMFLQRASEHGTISLSVSMSLAHSLPVL